MNETTWLSYVTAIGAAAMPILVLILMAIGWRFRTRLERRFTLEDKLREDRISSYNKILEPFIIIFMSDAAWKSDPKNKNKDKFEIALRKMLSLEYREQGFRLALVGSDAVVKSYNELMQYFFQLSGPAEVDVKKAMSLVGQLLLEIRRSMGTETTELDKWDMLEWFITDAKKLR